MNESDKVSKFLSFCIGLFKDLESSKKGDILSIEFGGRRFAVVSMDERRNDKVEDSIAFEEFTG